MTIDIYGANLFLGGLDRVFSWVDLDLSNKPWKSFRHHRAAVRSIARHQKCLLTYFFQTKIYTLSESIMKYIIC